MYNHFVCVGLVGEGGTATTVKHNGTPVCGFRLRLTHTLRDGRHFASFLDVEAYGRLIDQAKALQPGTPLLLEGRLQAVLSPSGTSTFLVVASHLQSLPQEARDWVDSRYVFVE